MNITRQNLQEWHNPKQMNACAGDLHTLGSDTESEFLKIGGTLNKLADICFGMTDDAVQLTSLSSFSTDELSQGSSFVDETKTIFDEVAGHVKQSINSLNEGEHLLIDLISRINKLRIPIQKLYKIGRTFRVLGINIKVESSRNVDSAQGFQLLAEEVADIASLVRNNCQYCSDKTNLVERDITASKQFLDNSSNSYDDSGEEAIINILSTLNEIENKSETISSGIQQRSTAMVQGMSDVVMAMQFHDITRQQLENVAKALNATSEKLHPLIEKDSAPNKEEVALEVYGILSIQAAHLNSIYEQVFKAGKQIETGLEKIMDQARLQARDAGILLKMDGGTGEKSVVAGLEQEIDNIAVSFNKSLATVAHAARVSRDVYDNVSEIGNFVNTIEEIAFDVKLLAINAMVQALKTGDTGKPLMVLAKELSSLSLETRDEAAKSIEMLKSIMQATEKQLEFSTNLNQERDVVDARIESAKQVTGKVLSSMQEVSMLSLKIDKANGDLSTRITRLIPEIKFPEVMGNRIDRSWQTICGIIDQLEEEYPQFTESESDVEQMLEKLSQQYVMDRERSIHAQVTGKQADDTDSGDIELFGDDGFELFEDSPSEEPQTEEEGEFEENVVLF